MRTFWLSFADDETGKNLGVSVVDLDEAAIEIARIELFEIRREEFPHARKGAEVIMAATRAAREHGCNPGGQVICCEVTTAPFVGQLPRNRFLTTEETQMFGAA